MDDQVLGLLRFGMLGLLYLFFGRVMWAVWSQVRAVPVAHPAPPSGATPTVAMTRTSAVVRLVQPSHMAGMLDLSHGPVTIGRHPDCDVCLVDDSFLSQRHLRVGHGSGGVWVEDLGSTNGTFVDGRRLTGRHTVDIGGRVEVGGVVLEVS